jgi:hypothetical protein
MTTAKVKHSAVARQAIECGNATELKRVLESHPSHHLTHLLFCAIEYSQTECLQILIEKGADPNAPNSVFLFFSKVNFRFALLSELVFLPLFKCCWITALLLTLAGSHRWCRQ